MKTYSSETKICDIIVNFCTKFDQKTYNRENMIDNERLLVTFREHYEITRVLLTITDDGTALYPIYNLQINESVTKMEYNGLFVLTY